MIINFKNIGIVESANIELKGLTIITGVNDTGKSFLSKTIYSVIKTINEASDQQKVEQTALIQNTLNQAFLLYRQNLIITTQKLQQVSPNLVMNDVLRIILVSSYIDELNAILTNYKNKLIDDLKESSNQTKRDFGNVISKIEKLFDELFKIILEEGDHQNKFIKFFDNLIIGKLFQKQFSPLNSTIQSSIIAKEGENEILNISIRDNRTEQFQTTELFNFKDATLIETPTILQLSRYIFTTLAVGQPLINKRMVQQRSDLPYHYYDLIEKLFAGSTGTHSDSIIDLNKKIENIINGKVIFKPTESNFVFVKEKNEEVKSFNIASGIKSFGLLQLLLNSEAINQRSILIIDEPEVHLHPQWETEYARIIVALSKAGIPVLLSSHSPYFIRALVTYSRQANIVETTKFYFGEKRDKHSFFCDVTNDLGPIFKVLSKPMQDLFING